MELVQEQARATQGMGPILVHCRPPSLLAEQPDAPPPGRARTSFLHSCLLNKILEAPSNFSDSSYRPSRTRLALPRPLLAMSRTAPSPGGPSGRDHVVLTGPAGPEELWKLVWQHGTHVLVSGCPPDATEKDSRKEREVQRLQFPYLEPGRELPATNLLPFLAAVGQCCSRGNSKKPGTLLSCSSKGATQLGTFLAMEQLLQQAGSECTVDVFNVALQRSQACSLMTPTLLRGDQRRRG
ncbi:receptor-type tyrosine-protein phosphatase V-like isoform X9 [Macaca fascicularis]|uniref:receptor-type tyrosine-protein phosphatase V-like isoform X9 n=2 Tax=Macaca fascicularis TaxID=9541 RepID=UPI0032B05B70